MARSKGAIPAAPRKTILEWIEHDGDTTPLAAPPDDKGSQAFHARIAHEPDRQQGRAAGPMPAPSGLRLPPLG
jgi:hypothetical protein